MPKPVTLVRESRRSANYRAYHEGMNKLVNVHTISLEGPDGDAMVSLPGTSLVFRVLMGDLQLLEDTSRDDMHGVAIFEGDIIQGMVQNEYGSFQKLRGPVLFDENHWGFSVNFPESGALPFSGLVADIEVVGNLFESIPNEENVPQTEEGTRVA